MWLELFTRVLAHACVPRLACRDLAERNIAPGYSTDGQVCVRSIGLPGETGDFFELTQIFEAAALFPVPDYLVPMTPQSRNGVELIGAGGVHVHGCLTCHSIIAFPVVASETPSFDQLELAACIVPPRKAPEAGSFRRSETSADPGQVPLIIRGLRMPLSYKVNRSLRALNTPSWRGDQRGARSREQLVDFGAA